MRIILFVFDCLFQLLYIVSSDDSKWCKETFKSKERKFFFTADARNKDNLAVRDLDMTIAANCNHTIYDYGTFGFWGAYLAGGHTILAQNMSPTKTNPEVENIKAANLLNWERIEAFTDF